MPGATGQRQKEPSLEPEFLNLGAIYIWGRLIVGGCSLLGCSAASLASSYRMPLAFATKDQNLSPDIGKCPLGVENHFLESSQAFAPAS